MESDIALALMQKARHVFERDGTFLSFPLAPISFEPEDLDFFKDSEDDPTGKIALNNLAQFSRDVNLIPDGTIFPPVEELYLWDVYDDILTHGVTALDQLSEQERQSLQVVVETLYVETQNGVRTLSEKYSKYNEFRDADITLREQFNTEKIEVEASEVAEEHTKWENKRLPEWRARVKALKGKWSSEGFRVEIEDALRREAALMAQTPLATWDNWASMFDKDLDVRRTIGAQLPFVVTSFSPSNATRDGSWIEFTMSGAAARKLILDAPEPLRLKLEGQALALAELDSLTFEYSTAKIERFWFAPQIFKSRFFKYSKVISAGEQGGSGICEAYIAGVVFAKNIQVHKTAAKGNPNVPSASNSVRVATKMSFNFANQERAKLFEDRRLEFHRFPKVLAPKSSVSASRKPNLKSAQRTNARKAAAHAAPKLFAQMMMIKPKTVVKKAPIVQRPNVKFFAAFQAQTMVATAVKPGPTPHQKPPLKEDKSIYILGFICKKVPKCPDPDPDLKWEF